MFQPKPKPEPKPKPKPKPNPNPNQVSAFETLISYLASPEWERQADEAWGAGALTLTLSLT